MGSPLSDKRTKIEPDRTLDGNITGVGDRSKGLEGGHENLGYSEPQIEVASNTDEDVQLNDRDKKKKKKKGKKYDKNLLIPKAPDGKTPRSLEKKSVESDEPMVGETSGEPMTISDSDQFWSDSDELPDSAVEESGGNKDS